MALERKSIDRDTLSAALLPLAKSQMRVDFTRDDAYITSICSRAVDFFEKITELSVFPAEYDWTLTDLPIVLPSWNRYAGSSPQTGWKVPVQPISAWVATDAADDDVTADFTLWGQTTGDTFQQVFLGYTGTALAGQAYFGDFTISLQTGYDDLPPPSMQDAILRMAAWLYENREMAGMPGTDMMSYFNTVLAGFWVPRC